MGKLKDTFGELLKKFPSLKNPEDFLALIETFDRNNELFKILLNDSMTSKDASRADIENQYLRRTFVRTSFATIEGLLNILNQSVVDIYKNEFFALTNEELENLTEETRTKKGETRLKFMPLNKKLQFSFEIFARKIGGIDYKIDTTTDKWKEFENAIYIRNRLTHPRLPEDMLLDEKQMAVVLNAYSWFVDIYKEMESKTAEASSKKSLEALRAC